MFNGWTDNLLVGIQTLNQILTAGIAITAFSLFLYSLSFNLRDRVAQILRHHPAVRGGGIHDGSAAEQIGVKLGSRIHFCGCNGSASYSCLPPTCTCRTHCWSRPGGLRGAGGASRFAPCMRVSALFLLALALGYLLGPLVASGKPAPHLQRTFLTEVFTVYYVAAMIWAGINFVRAYSPHAHPFGPAPHALPDGRCDRAGTWLVSLSALRKRCSRAVCRSCFGAWRPASTYWSAGW